ncbi:AAA family ATPase [Breznakiellaceae bacterium SP9]
MSVKTKIETILAQLNAGVFEKEEGIRLALLSSIAGENIFLFGPPGVSKSLIARKLKFAYKNASVFEYLLSRYSTPDELFGPVSLSKLKDEDKYERVCTNYLPAADVAFLDEIWKASPAIQNTLLTILNEKKFRNGEKELDVPLKTLIAAASDLPAREAGLEPLWDRFLVRTFVSGITDALNFRKLLSFNQNPYEDTVSDKISLFEYQGWSEQINEIIVPDTVFHVIEVIRNKIALSNEHNDPIYVSDRRWRHIVRLLRTSAFLNDRGEVDLMDCFLIKDCIWSEYGQKEAVFQFVSSAIEESGYTVSFDFTETKEELDSFRTEIAEETKFIHDTRATVLAEFHQEYYGICNFNNNDNNFISKTDFDGLTNQNGYIYLFYWHSSYNAIYKQLSYITRKGTTKQSLFINDTEYQLKTVVRGDKRQITKRPHPSVEKDWDARVNTLLSHTAEMKEQIEDYRRKDSEHLRSNLFVEPALANIVEAHVIATIREIELIEAAVRQTQNEYKRLKDEEIVLSD